jgi:hypothetical protein
MAKRKEQKKKEREKRVAQKKLAARKRAQEQKTDEPAASIPKTKKVFSVQSNMKTDFVANMKKPTHTHRRAGS